MPSVTSDVPRVWWTSTCDGVITATKQMPRQGPSTIQGAKHQEKGTAPCRLIPLHKNHDRDLLDTTPTTAPRETVQNMKSALSVDHAAPDEISGGSEVHRRGRMNVHLPIYPLFSSPQHTLE